jgi:hypothetical protein
MLAFLMMMAAGGQMLKQDAVAPIFAAGPAVEDAAFAGWLTGNKRLLKLPFTLWLGELSQVKQAAVGDVATQPPKRLHLDDSALGVALNDRLRSLAKQEKRVVVYLAGRFSATDTFAVFAVHEKAEAGKTLRSFDERGPGCLAIVTIKDLHCARGAGRCEKCDAAAAKPARPKLIDVCPYNAQVYARPTVELDGVSRVYDVLETFESIDAARAFASKHQIERVKP